MRFSIGPACARLREKVCNYQTLPFGPLETAQTRRAIEEISFHKGLQAATLRPFCPLQIMIADHDYLRRPESTQRRTIPLPWTRITDPNHAAELLPAWFSGRMIGERGSFGLLLTTGDVMRVTSITAVAQSSEGTQLIDVLLDSAGVPQGVDLAWQSKHYLGAPIPGATLATINAAHVVALIEFTAAELVEPTAGLAIDVDDDGELPPELEAMATVPAMTVSGPR
jgi:hypothetical protein